MSDLAAQPSRATRRIGHKGADHIAPGNTLASFDAALAHAVDMIEFDVLPEHMDGTGRLLLAHDYVDARRREPLTLEEGLAHFAGAASPAWTSTSISSSGLRAAGGRRAARHGLARAHADLHDGGLSPKLARGSRRRIRWVVGPQGAAQTTSRHRPRRPSLLAVPTAPRVPRPGAALRARARSRRSWPLGLVPPRSGGDPHAGGELYVWTVDDAEKIAQFEAMGVTGIISNDPRLFG
jgi:glycerophosphoryl diester phosphodiesterase